MSEPTTSTNAIEEAANLLRAADGPAEAAAAVVTQGEPADDDLLGDGGKKALRAEREARTKAERQAADLKAKLDRIEAANLTDLERAQRESAQAQEAAAKAAADLARFRLATRYGLTEDEAADLPDDPEKAERLASRLSQRKSDTTADTKPKPDLTQGAQQAAPLNGDELTNMLARAVGAG